MKEDTNTEKKLVNSWFFHVMEKCIDLAANYFVKMKEDTNTELKTGVSEVEFKFFLLSKVKISQFC